MGRNNDKIILSKEEEELFIETVETFIKTNRFDRKFILQSYKLVATMFDEAYREKFKDDKDNKVYREEYGEDRGFPLLQASKILKHLFADVLDGKGIRFNRNVLLHFEDERDKRKVQEIDDESDATGDKRDAADIASEIKDRVITGALA